jgi:hypothetical protein
VAQVAHENPNVPLSTFILLFFMYLFVWCATCATLKRIRRMYPDSGVAQQPQTAP